MEYWATVILTVEGSISLLTAATSPPYRRRFATKRFPVGAGAESG
jgi:hypothetical protein